MVDIFYSILVKYHLDLPITQPCDLALSVTMSTTDYIRINIFAGNLDIAIGWFTLLSIIYM